MVSKGGILLRQNTSDREAFKTYCIMSARLLGDSHIGLPHMLLGILSEDDLLLTKIITQEYEKGYVDLFVALLQEKTVKDIRADVDEGNTSSLMGMDFKYSSSPSFKEKAKKITDKNIEKEEDEISKITMTREFAMVLAAASDRDNLDFFSAVSDELLNTRFGGADAAFEYLGLKRKEVAKKFQLALEDVELEEAFKEQCTEVMPDSLEKEVLGRDEVIFQIYMNLAKKTKASVILVGDAGVGKTAIVEELARQIATEECPTAFKNYRILSLDIGSALAGTTLRGQFEERIQNVLKILQKKSNIILFIDEIHNMVGAGTSKGEGIDMANMLKPLLSRDNLKVIGATTIEEMDRINKDRALARRFMPIEIKEPKTSEVYDMISKKVEILERHHKVGISKEQVEEVIQYCEAHKPNQRFPDKAIDTIDALMSVAQLQEKETIDMDDLTKYNFDFNYTKVLEENRRKQENKVGF